MVKKRKNQPTAAELAILMVLWEKGSCTVRDVHEQIGRPKGTSYTTTLKLMQIMDEKGLLKRDKKKRPHIYKAVHSQDQTQEFLVSDLIERAFGGSTSELVLHALSSKPATKEELEEIRQLLNELESED